MTTETTASTDKTFATGKVVNAFGNLLHVEFEGNVRQGEVAIVELGSQTLRAEVIEIAGRQVKIQVFEDTRGITYGTPVRFTQDLLEAELGPGLLTSIVDGLQNPLEEVANVAGFFLPRGLYLPPLNRQTRWDYTPVAEVGEVLRRGETLGT